MGMDRGQDSSGDRDSALATVGRSIDRGIWGEYVRLSVRADNSDAPSAVIRVLIFWARFCRF